MQRWTAAQLRARSTLDQGKVAVRIPDIPKVPAPGLFIASLKALGLPTPEVEFYFALPRLWRADFGWPNQRVLLEVEGGAWIQGRHTRGKGFIADMQKYNRAALLGYRLLRYTPQQLMGSALVDLADILKRRP